MFSTTGNFFYFGSRIHVLSSDKCTNLKNLKNFEEGKSVVDTLFNSIGIEVVEFDKECAVQ
ncbi:hypothetical protein PNA2_1523 [Pyrococcus sp. NA2]|nr:hypothetical protein PNA2_1523 [Pyrococcus sp. NA2]